MSEKTGTAEKGPVSVEPRCLGGGHSQAALQRRLEARCGEMAQAIITRIYGIVDRDEVPDAEYVQGLRGAVPVGVRYGLVALSRGHGVAPPVPLALLEQARAAARAGVKLKTVLRRYCAAHALVNDFIVEEAERGGLVGKGVLRQLFRTQELLLDQLIRNVSEAYEREMACLAGLSQLNRVERVERLLAGELVDVSPLAYAFDGHHVGIVATGPEAEKTIRDLAGMLDRRLLAVERGERIWAWFGGREPFDPDRLLELSMKVRPAPLALAIGEPGEGLVGWRITHRQASLAHPIALRRGEGPVRYANVALLASALRDELLASSLHKLYLAPLEAERDGGQKLRRTLRAHFTPDGHIGSTASLLGANRNTVASRLRKVEDYLGRTLGSCAAELETALSLDEFRRLPDPPIV